MRTLKSLNKMEKEMTFRNEAGRSKSGGVGIKINRRKSEKSEEEREDHWCPVHDAM